MKIKYENSGLELLGRMLIWCFASMLIITIPWVINDIITYFSKGFKILK
jgi:hypothetical protein